jgi:hypothetical protein
VILGYIAFRIQGLCADLCQTWTSYPGLAAQIWYLTTDGRIAITGGTQCLDEGANGESPSSLINSKKAPADPQVPRLIPVLRGIPTKVPPSSHHSEVYYANFQLGRSSPRLRLRHLRLGFCRIYPKGRYMVIRLERGLDEESTRTVEMIFA